MHQEANGIDWQASIHILHGFQGTDAQKTGHFPVKNLSLGFRVLTSE